MVLIIRNNRIQSRGSSRLKRLISRVVPANRENYFVRNRRRSCEDVGTPSEVMSNVAILGSLFLYSMAMFTLPFAAFYGVQHVLTLYHTDRFTTNCLSVLAAVVTVNLVIAGYVYKAFHESDEPKEADETGDEIPSDGRSHGKSD